jgi:hypothetical protein
MATPESASAPSTTATTEAQLSIARRFRRAISALIRGQSSPQAAISPSSPASRQG